MSQRFVPEHFFLEPNPFELELDTEVDARIANEVYAHNKAGHAGNNWEISQFRIDPTGMSESRAPSYSPDSNGYTANFIAGPSFLKNCIGTLLILLTRR